MTIKEVARLAGVSDATVSRVLNGCANVSDETRKRVLQMVEETGYRPNLLGRNLRRSKTGNILVLVPSAANDYYSRIVRGIESVARERNWFVLICNTYENPEIESHFLSMLKNRLADGVICFGTVTETEELRRIVRDFPFVFCSEYRKDVPGPYVGIDNEKAAYEAVTHLIRQGYDTVGFAGGGDRYPSNEDRLKGYLRALEEAGIPPREEYILGGFAYSFRGGYAAFERFAALEEPPKAIFAVADTIAAGIVRKCNETGRKTAVAGFDDINVASVITPSLTTVRQPRKEMGVAAMRMLAERMEQKAAVSGESPVRIFPHELVVRESSRIT